MVGPWEAQKAMKCVSHCLLTEMRIVLDYRYDDVGEQFQRKRDCRITGRWRRILVKMCSVRDCSVDIVSLYRGNTWKMAQENKCSSAVSLSPSMSPKGSDNSQVSRLLFHFSCCFDSNARDYSITVDLRAKKKRHRTRNSRRENIESSWMATSQGETNLDGSVS